MGLDNIPADLLAALQRIEEKRASDWRLAHSIPHVAWDRIAHYVSDHLPTVFTLATFSPDLKDTCRP